MKKFVNIGLLGIAAIAALLSGIFFNVVSTTGYLAGNPYNVGVTVMCIIAAVIICASAISRFFGEKIAMALQIVAVILLAVGFVLMLMDKANFLGDSFIPMERPAEFTNGINLTYASLILLAVSAVFLAANGFVGNPDRK